MPQHDDDDELDGGRDPHLDAVMDAITKNYQPADSVETATLRLTTSEVYDLVRQHYPASTYNVLDVYQILEELGYRTADVYGDMVLRWLIQRLP